MFTQYTYFFIHSELRLGCIRKIILFYNFQNLKKNIMNRRFLGLSFFLVAQVILQLKLELFKPTIVYNVTSLITF